MSEKAYLIFDFDGTLVNSFDVMVTKFLQLSESFGFRKLSIEDLDSLRDLPSRALIKHLQIPFYKIPTVIYQVRKSMRTEMSSLEPFAGLPEILKALVEQGCKLGILTSNSQENVATWLIKNNLQHLFEFIHNEANFFGKNRVLKKILKQYQIERRTAFYIGDETRDIDAAHANAIASIAVTWGFNSEHTLAKLNPNYIARKPEDLLEIIQGM